DLSRALADQGHEIGLLVDSIAYDARTEELLAALAARTSLGIHRTPMPRMLGWGDLTAPLAVRRLARQLKIDVLHGHGAKGGFYGRLSRLAGTRAATIYTPHGGVLHFPRSSMSGRIFHGLEHALVGQTDAIVFESRFALDTYSALVAPPACPTTVIHNGLTAAEFAPIELAPDAADFVFVGELRQLKGIHMLVEALVGVTRPDGAPANLVMAGDGPERSALIARINTLGLADRITLPGAQPARAMFARGKIAIVPSLAESLPYIVLEAIAAQRPLIATHVGGIPEICGPTSNELIAPSDVRALRRAMQASLDDPTTAAATAAIRHQRVASLFSVSHMAGSIEKLYHDVRNDSLKAQLHAT
ncbi:MAG TPA: glycosyltransferase family 4 protein, partial [Devosia sp.]|nr:glycosyltransferase family 4 protein [Devosia sp.]